MDQIKEANKYLADEKAKMVKHQIPPKSHKIISGLIEEVGILQKTLKEVSGCHENHNTPKLCSGCLGSIRAALGE